MDLHSLGEQSLLQLSDFVPLGKIGEGAFSEVYKVRSINDGKIYALKKIRIQALKPKEKQYAVNEIKILSSISSKFVISYRQSFYDDSTQQLCIVMEWANEGDLSKDIATRRKENHDSFPQSEIWRAIRDILKGLNLLHSNCILHRDIKAANIFKSEGVYKVGDLNVAKVCPKMVARTQTGTPYYASPEVWDEQPYDEKSDIWSFGCVVYQICELHHPFESSDMQRLHRTICQGIFEPIHRKYSKQLQELIRICLKVNPKDRLNSKELLNLSWVKDKLKMYRIENRTTLKTEPRNHNYSSFKRGPLMRPRSRKYRLIAPTEQLIHQRSHLGADRKHYLSAGLEQGSKNNPDNQTEPTYELQGPNPQSNCRKQKSSRFASESMNQQTLAQQQRFKESKYCHPMNNNANGEKQGSFSKIKHNSILRPFQFRSASNASQMNNNLVYANDRNPTVLAQNNQIRANSRQVGVLRGITRPFSAEVNDNKSINSKYRNANLNCNAYQQQNIYRQQKNLNSIGSGNKQQEDEKNKISKQRRETSNVDLQQNIPNKILREIISNRAKNIHEKYAEQLRNPPLQGPKTDQNHKIITSSLYSQSDLRVGSNQNSSRAQLGRELIMKDKSEYPSNLKRRLGNSKFGHRPASHYFRPLSQKYRCQRYVPMQVSLNK